MKNDNLQGILFNAKQTIQFIDVTTRHQRVIGETRRVMHRATRLKNQYKKLLPRPSKVLTTDMVTNRLHSRDATDIAERFLK